MTERLSTLLREEAWELPVPVPDAHAILRQGRGVRLRRRVGSVVAAGVAVAVVAGGFAALDRDPGGGGQAIPPVTEPLSASEGAFAVGSMVWPEGASRPAIEVDGKVKAVYYTSEGVLARVGNTPWSDDPGPSRYVAFDVTGGVGPHDLGIDLGDRVPGTDPAQPFLAYADDASASGDARWDLVVRDVRDGTEVARVPVEGAFTWGGWEAPPVSLSGDQAYVGLDEHTAVVDWRTGEVRESSVLTGSQMPVVSGGRSTTRDPGDDATVVVDAVDGEVLLSVPNEQAPYVSLSPDGRYAKVVLQVSPESEESFTVHDLATGAERTVDGAPWEYGWTADGDLLKVGKDEVTVCEPLGAGQCSSDPVDLGKGEVKLAGLLYES